MPTTTTRIPQQKTKFMMRDTITTKPLQEYPKMRTGLLRYRGLRARTESAVNLPRLNSGYGLKASTRSAGLDKALKNKPEDYQKARVRYGK